MKIQYTILIGVLTLIVFIVGYKLFHRTSSSLNYAPKRPPSLPKEAVWAGGVDGGAWYVVDSQKPAPDVWQIRVYRDNGSPWVRGSFWWKEATNMKALPSFSAFDGNVIYLEGNKKMFPVGALFYPEEQATKVIIYPSPSSDYKLEQIGEREDKPESW
jgi:hypothetical protein